MIDKSFAVSRICSAILTLQVIDFRLQLCYCDKQASDNFRAVVDTFTGLKLADKQKQQDLECMRPALSVSNVLCML